MMRIYKHPEKALFLRQHAGEAKGEDFHIDLGINMSDGSFIGIYENKKTGKSVNCSFPLRQFVEEILAVERGESECIDMSKEST